MKTETLLSGAKSRAKDLIEKAESKAAQIIEHAQNEVRKIQKSYTTIEQHREQLMSSLKILSQDMLQKIQRMENMPQVTAMNEVEEQLLQLKDTKNRSKVDNNDSLSPSHQVVTTTRPKKKAKAPLPAGKTKKSFFDELK